MRPAAKKILAEVGRILGSSGTWWGALIASVVVLYVGADPSVVYLT